MLLGAFLTFVLFSKKIPVTFYYGDYIGEEFTDVPAAAMWGFMASTADTFTTSYTAAGGISTVVHLPDEGITGNDHFMFQDMNWLLRAVNSKGAVSPEIRATASRIPVTMPERAAR